jgi:hypothetical protein
MSTAASSPADTADFPALVWALSEENPASKVEELTPRVWKDLFADNPLR